ncbi:hypothetical protein GmHk_03G007011 [Glycine max]|nr:hypothetical protein GmHk_03G007011 [Glycine max]
MAIMAIVGILTCGLFAGIMARAPDTIKSINGSKETLKLVVRIIDIWFVGTSNNSKQAEMVIIDSHGDAIHVFCKQDQLKSWKVDLMENCTYVMHNFKVMKNDGQFRVCDHQYKLVFTGVTFVRQSDLEDLPFKKYKFVDFTNVIIGLFQPELLVDIIGVVDEVVFHHVGSKSTRVVFKLKDLRLCCAIDLLTNDFLDYLNESENYVPIIIILTHAQIKEVQGSYPPSVSNSLRAYKLLINEVVFEIEEFRERLSDLGIQVRSVLTPGGQGSSQLLGSSQLSSKDAFLSKAEAKTISEINNISEVTVSTINRIVMDNHSWCYPACSQCYKKMMLRQPHSHAHDCECTELIGQSANEVNKLKIEEGDVDLNVSPQALDKLLGYVLAFKVKVQPNFNNVVVLRYSNDLDLINAVVDMLLDAEITSDECDDEPKSFQISPAQLSSNKLARHDQIE